MGRARPLGLSVAFCYISLALRITATLDGKMNKIAAISLSVILAGCATSSIRPQARPYDNPNEGYVVYTPKTDHQGWEGVYLRGFYSKGTNYVTNCAATTAIIPGKNLQASIRFVEGDDVVYLDYMGGPRFAKCDINYDAITAQVEQYIARQKKIAQAKNEAENGSSERRAYSDNAYNEILFLDKPYATTHIAECNIDCVWTKDDKGRLVSEAGGPDGTGVCWDQKAYDLAKKLHEDKKLIWHSPPNFEYEYGNKNTCYYKVDKKGGVVLAISGDSATAADDCHNSHNKERALSFASKARKTVEFGGYVATKENLLGSVVLACYTGTLNRSGELYVSKQEQADRYKALLDLYEGDPAGAKRITSAFNFARSNLSDRYPLDTMGRFRAGVCDQMVMKGKL